jgi:hypothetical protein
LQRLRGFARDFANRYRCNSSIITQPETNLPHRHFTPASFIRIGMNGSLRLKWIGFFRNKVLI